MIRKLSILMSAFLMMLMLVGCSSEEPTETTEVEETEEVEVAEEETEQVEYQYSNSIYKVGVDMPAGEYYVEVLAGEDSGYYSVNNDANGDDIYYNENITTHSYITVTDGQYVELDDLYAVPVAEAPSVVPTDGLYKSGVYKVGTDIPAGEYKVTTAPGEDSGYYSIHPDSTYQDIVANDNLDAGGSAYITVTDGEYLLLDGVELQAN